MHWSLYITEPQSELGYLGNKAIIFSRLQNVIRDQFLRSISFKILYLRVLVYCSVQNNVQTSHDIFVS